MNSRAKIAITTVAQSSRLTGWILGLILSMCICAEAQTDGFLTAFTVNSSSQDLCDFGCATAFGAQTAAQVHLPAFGTFEVSYYSRICTSGPDTYHDIAIVNIVALMPAGADAFEGFSFACIIDEISQALLYTNPFGITASATACDDGFRVTFYSCWQRYQVGESDCLVVYSPCQYPNALPIAACCANEYCCTIWNNEVQDVDLLISQGSGTCDVPEGSNDPQVYLDQCESACGACVD